MLYTKLSGLVCTLSPYNLQLSWNWTHALCLQNYRVQIFIIDHRKMNELYFLHKHIAGSS